MSLISTGVKAWKDKTELSQCPFECFCDALTSMHRVLGYLQLASMAAGTSPARQGLRDKLGLRWPSSVAGIPPSSSQAGAQGSGASAAASSWQLFSQGSQQPAWGQSRQAGE